MTKSFVYGILGAGMTLIIGVQILLWFTKGERPSFESFGSFFILFIFAGAVSGNLKNIAKQAAELQDPATIGPMLELLDATEADIVTIAKESLTKSLLRLTPESAALLEPHHFKALQAHAIASKEADFAESCVKALGAFGDSTAIKSLERITKGEFGQKDSGKERLMTSAKMALGDIRLREARRIIGPAVEEMAENQVHEEERLQLGRATGDPESRG